MFDRFLDWLSKKQKQTGKFVAFTFLVLANNTSSKVLTHGMATSLRGREGVFFDGLGRMNPRMAQPQHRMRSSAFKRGKKKRGKKEVFWAVGCVRLWKGKIRLYHSTDFRNVNDPRGKLLNEPLMLSVQRGPFAKLLVTLLVASERYRARFLLWESGWTKTDDALLVVCWLPFFNMFDLLSASKSGWVADINVTKRHSYETDGFRGFCHGAEQAEQFTWQAPCRTMEYHEMKLVICSGLSSFQSVRDAVEIYAGNIEAQRCLWV